MDADDRVLAVVPVGKGSRQRTPTIALAAGVPVHVAVGVLMRAHASGLVGRMEVAGRETWWRWTGIFAADGQMVDDQPLFELSPGRAGAS